MNENQIQEFLDDQLSAEDKSKFLEKMEKEPSLKKMVDEYRILNSILEKDNLLPVSPEIAKNVLAAVSTKYRNPFSLNSLFWFITFFIALSTLPFLIEFTTVTEEWKNLNLSETLSNVNLTLWGFVLWGLLLIAWLDSKLSSRIKALLNA